MLTAVGLLLAMQASGEVQFEQPTLEELRARLEVCGFEQITVAYEDELQSDVVSVGDETATDEQLKCAAKALDLTFYIAEFRPKSQARFYEFQNELARPRAVARAHKYFAKQPELGDPPARSTGESDFALAKRIEKFCGPDAGGAFTDEFGGVTVSPDWTGQSLTEEQSHERYSVTLECLMHAMTLADLKFGFVGNERPVASESADAHGTE